MTTPLNILTFGITFYLIWAFVYHKRDKSLTWPIFMEYFLTAVLVLILLLGILYN